MLALLQSDRSCQFELVWRVADRQALHRLERALRHGPKPAVLRLLPLYAVRVGRQRGVVDARCPIVVFAVVKVARAQAIPGVGLERVRVRIRRQVVAVVARLLLFVVAAHVDVRSGKFGLDQVDDEVHFRVVVGLD